VCNQVRNRASNRASNLATNQARRQAVIKLLILLHFQLCRLLLRLARLQLKKDLPLLHQCPRPALRPRVPYQRHSTAPARSQRPYRPLRLVLIPRSLHSQARPILARDLVESQTFLVPCLSCQVGLRLNLRALLRTGSRLYLQALLQAVNQVNQAVNQVNILVLLQVSHQAVRHPLHKNSFFNRLVPCS
jgi:hypothetical protein